MIFIVPGITTLMQYIIEQQLEATSIFVCVKCPHCGSTQLWKHGYYHRKADRYNCADQLLNPILIQRFICRNCKKTCSALPECIPPRRWYLWEIQQSVLLLILAGKTIYAIAKDSILSRHTVSRWISRFKEQFALHKFTLSQHFVDLGRTINFTDFWQNCLRNISLAQAMRICHVTGVNIP